MSGSATKADILSRYPKRVLMRYCVSVFGWEDVQALKIIALSEVLEDLSGKLADIGVAMQNAADPDEFEGLSERYNSVSEQIESTEDKLTCEREKLQRMVTVKTEAELEAIYRESPTT